MCEPSHWFSTRVFSPSKDHDTLMFKAQKRLGEGQKTWLYYIKWEKGLVSSY